MNETATNERNVMVIDPHEVCRHAATNIIENSGGELTLVATARADGSAADMAAHVRPDVILVGLDGIEDMDLLEQLHLRAPEARILVLSSRDDAPALFDAVRSGASGFLPHYAEPADVLDALRTVASGGVAIHPTLTGEGVLFAARRIDDSLEAGRVFAKLTRRERETLTWLSHGMTARDIGLRMNVSRRTAERHLANAYRKLGTHNRRDAAAAFTKLVDLTT